MQLVLIILEAYVANIVYRNVQNCKNAEKSVTSYVENELDFAKKIFKKVVSK